MWINEINHYEHILLNYKNLITSKRIIKPYEIMYNIAMLLH